MFRPNGHPWGTHRVLKPQYSLPQAAETLDNSLPIYGNEIGAQVTALHLDAASFHQLKSHTSPLGEQIAAIVKARGKMHNPVTNSGGVFLGTVLALGPHHPLRETLKIGDSIVSLVSLTLTPLHLERIMKIHDTGHVDVHGHAIIFESGMLAKIPPDLPAGVVMAALDVCGAPAQVNRSVKKGDGVLILGLGKAGRAMAIQAELNGAQVFGIDAAQENVSWCSKNMAGHFERMDARDPIKVYNWVHGVTQGRLVDMAFHATSVDNTEMSAILPVRQGGRSLFFGMQTSFQKAVLGAEGLGLDIELVMGNGYVPGHAELMLDLVRNHGPLKEWFLEKYGK